MGIAISDLAKQYRENIKEGKYALPNILVLRDLLHSRYGEDRVDTYFLEGNTNDAIDENIMFSIRELDTERAFNFVLSTLAIRDRTVETFNDRYLLVESYFKYLEETRRVRMQVVIKYPSIKVTNSVRKEHTIQDLFMKMEIRMYDSNSLTVGYPVGRKSTYTLAEITSGYIHSHLTRLGRNPLNIEAFQSWHSMCLGVGPLANLIPLIETNRCLDPYIEMSQVFIALDQALAWESLEGTPYVKMQELSIVQDDTRCYSFRDIDYETLDSTSNDTLLRAFYYLLDTDIIENILNRCTLKSGVFNGFPRYFLDYDEFTLQKYLYNALSSLIHDLEIAEGDDSDRRRGLATLINNSVRLMKQDSFGNPEYFVRSGNTSYPGRVRSMQGVTLFHFKGVPVTLNIIDLDEASRNITDLPPTESYAHPRIVLLRIIHHLERIINEQFTKPSCMEAEPDY